jgi:hypothetical protein
MYASKLIGSRKSTSTREIVAARARLSSWVWLDRSHRAPPTSTMLSSNINSQGYALHATLEGRVAHRVAQVTP